jgi:hypothetical protein
MVRMSVTEASWARALLYGSSSDKGVTRPGPCICSFGAGHLPSLAKPEILNPQSTLAQQEHFHPSPPIVGPRGQSHYFGLPVFDELVVHDTSPRASWHIDSDFGKIVTCARPEVGASSGLVGRWGEKVARNYLAERGIYTVKHAVFWLPEKRVITDLYHPPSRTVFEVKTKAGPNEPNFRPCIYPYKRLIELNLANRAVFMQVILGSSRALSYSQWLEIHGAGIQVTFISG